MHFQGKEIVEVVEATRITKEQYSEVKENNHYYYALRHGDDGDWSVPVTIEHSVLVNYWGYMITKEPFDFPQLEDCIVLTEAEGFEIVDMRSYN